MNRELIKLGDVADLIYGPAFKSTFFLDVQSEGTKLVRGDNVQQGYIRWGDKTKKWPIENCDAHIKYQLQVGDIVLAMDRPIVGGGLKLAWISEDDLPALLVQRVCRIRGQKNLAYTDFLRYVLSSQEFSAHVEKITTGANIPHISGKDIAAYEFKLLSLEEQKQIVSALKAYDDLIAINQRRIQLLEEAARRLYREWFVHLRFPGYEEAPVEDGIPESWRKESLGNLAEVIMGQSPKSEFYNKDGHGLPFHQGVTQFGNRFVTDTTFTTEYSREARAGDILCSVRAPVGRLNICRNKIAIGRGLSTMCSKLGWQSLLYYQLKDYFVQEDMIGGGAIFASVGKKELLGQKLLQPTDELADRFNDLAKKNDDQIECLSQQNSLLQQARDQLLPRLMSAQMDISRIKTES